MSLEDFLNAKKFKLKEKGKISLQCKIKVNAKITAFRHLSLDQKTLAIAIKEPPIDGKANKALIKFLSDYFGVAKFNIGIKVGKSSGMKIVRINDQ